MYNFLLHLLVFDLVQLLFLLQISGEKLMNLRADDFSFLEVFDNFEGDQWYFAQFSTLLLAQPTLTNSRNFINLLQNLVLEHMFLQLHVTLD